MILVEPEPSRVEEMQLILVVAHELAQAFVMEDESSLLIDQTQSGRTALQQLPELPLLLGKARLALLESRDVVQPRDPLAADEADVPAPVTDLDIRDQERDELPLLRFPDHFLVQELPAAFAKRFDDPVAVLEVGPKPFGVEEVQLVLVVAHELAQPCVMEDDPPLLIDDVERGRTMFQDLAELPLVLGHLGRAPIGLRRQAVGARRGGGPVIGHRDPHRVAAPVARAPARQASAMQSLPIRRPAP